MMYGVASLGGPHVPAFGLLNRPVLLLYFQPRWYAISIFYYTYF